MPQKFSASALDRRTIDAYRHARYRVCSGAADAWSLRIGDISVRLQAEYARCGRCCAAFVTACNPLGAQLPAAVNAQRQRTLQGLLEALGLPWLPGMGEDPAGRWPGEASFLILGLERAEAQALGRRFEQNAIVWAGPEARAELILLR